MYGLAVKASAPTPATVPNGVGVAPASAWRVGGRGDVDVAALGVGQDEQAARVRVLDDALQRRASRAAPRRSKQASCGLTATQAGPAASIGRRAVRGDRDGGALGR